MRDLVLLEHLVDSGEFGHCLAGFGDHALVEDLLQGNPSVHQDRPLPAKGLGVGDDRDADPEFAEPEEIVDLLVGQVLLRVVLLSV